MCVFLQNIAVCPIIIWSIEVFLLPLQPKFLLIMTVQELLPTIAELRE